MIQDEYYQMYLDEITMIPDAKGEEIYLLEKVAKGDIQAKNRLIEGTLAYVAGIAKEFDGKGVLLSDLIQESNIALMLCVEKYETGDFRTIVRAAVEIAIQAAIEEQGQETITEEEILARVNVLKDISQMMVEELGREATIEELAAKMKMTTDEIHAIMKVTLDAMSVHTDIEE